MSNKIRVRKGEEMNEIICGNCLDVIKTLPDKSINCVITSPPYWQLRDYGWTGQWGLEKTYQEYLEHLWQLMDEIHRVLKDDGTVWVNLGDSYSSNRWTNKPSTTGVSGTFADILTTKNIKEPDKCLLLIPHRFAIGCIDRGWILRNDIIWAKRNGMPESVTDRFSKKHEYIFLMAKQEKYYFDLDGIRDKIKYIEDSNNRQSRWSKDYEGLNQGKRNATTKIDKDISENIGLPRARQHREGYANNPDKVNSKGKNPGSVSDFWDIPTTPSSEKHYATFNTKLIDKPIIAGCPKDGIILDPFCGTGTTLLRAKMLGRNYIGIEGSAEYVKMANDKLKNYGDILI